MQAKRRYALLLTTIGAFALALWCRHILLFHSPQSLRGSADLEAKLTDGDLRFWASARSIWDRETDESLPKAERSTVDSRFDVSRCTMGRCFNFSRCRNDQLLVHIYPDSNLSFAEVASAPSEGYLKILRSIRDSRYFTDDPNRACLFVLSHDTLDRDRLSTAYVPNMQIHVDALPKELWDEGRNHLFFNLYHGTWPDYESNDLRFDPGFGMLARASSSNLHFRPGFDVAFPLFHSELPLRTLSNEHFHSVSYHSGGYLLSFKGKRYVYGIGSDTRNSVHHLHNGGDVVMLTTCKHGKLWQQMQDERCPEDNLQYDRWDYDSLMRNSSFCLVPRGRRLGSFRFLEALRAGCVPVVLSDDWVLPFEEIVHWPNALVRLGETQLVQIPELLRSIPPRRVLALKQQGQRLFRQYFSSVERIVFTTLELIQNRLRPSLSRGVISWDGPNGDVHENLQQSFSGDLIEYPFYRSAVTNPQLTAFIMAYFEKGNHLVKLVKAAAKSVYCKEIVILWCNQNRPLPNQKSFASVRVAVTIIDARNQSSPFILLTTNGRINVRTAAVFTMDDRVSLCTDEINFAMEVWRSFPSRLIGYFTRSHYWDSTRKEWIYTSKQLGHYSLVLTRAAIFHSFYLSRFPAWLPPSAEELLSENGSCFDLLLNFLIADVSSQSPLKLTHRLDLPRSSASRGGVNFAAKRQLLAEFCARQRCFGAVLTIFGGRLVTLKRSKVRLDPVLFKDQVSMLRKRYRQMEMVNDIITAT